LVAYPRKNIFVAGGITPADGPANTPVVPATVEQFPVGLAAIPQQVPRAVIVRPPSEVTLAPRVAPFVPIAVTVGEMTVGGCATVVVTSGDCP